MAGLVSRLGALFAETRRRSVFKVASVYAVTAWGASLGAADLLPAFGAPGWAVRVFVVCAVLGLPIAVVLAWAYEITPRGIVRDDRVAGSEAVDPPVKAPPQMTTVLHGSTGSVRVSWTDRRGVHEKAFDTGFKIGRDESCEIHIDDPMISRRHAEVSLVDGHWWIADLGSRNGTLVDGERVTRSPLPAYCEVRLYETAPVLSIEVRGGSKAATITSSRLYPGGT